MMASMGRLICAASLVVVVAITLISQTSEAKMLVVGNQAGWTNYDLSNYRVPNYGAWAISERAVVGDSIVFRYAKGLHNVNLLPNLAAFKSCDFSRAKLLDRGESGTYIWRAMAPGVYFFGCNKEVEAEGNHCGSGQKFSLVVRGAPTSNEIDGDEAEIAVLAAMSPGPAVVSPPVLAPSSTTPAIAPPVSSPLSATPASSAPTSPASAPTTVATPPVLVAAPSSQPTTGPASSPVANTPMHVPPSTAPASVPSSSVPATPPTSSPPAFPSSPPSIPSAAPTTTSPTPVSSPSPFLAAQSPTPTVSSPPPPPTFSPVPAVTSPSTPPQSSPPSPASALSPVISPLSSPVSSVASPPAPPLSSGGSVVSPGPSTSAASISGCSLVAAVLWSYLFTVGAEAVMHL